MRKVEGNWDDHLDGGSCQEDKEKGGFLQIRGKQYTGTKVQSNTRNILETSSLFRSVVTKQHVFDDEHVHVTRDDTLHHRLIRLIS